MEIAARYNEQGADELTFLDITATSDDRDPILHIIEAVASQVFIPLTVGGGVRTVADAPAAQRRRRQGQLQLGGGGQSAGDPDASAKYGAQCIVVAIDAEAPPWRRARRAGTFTRTAGARTPGTDAVPGGRSQMAEHGAGEILLTSMDRDGTKIGFDPSPTRAVSDAVDVPVIASGGVGALEHLSTASDRRRRRGAGREHLPLRRVHGRPLPRCCWRATAFRCGLERAAARGPHHRRAVEAQAAGGRQTWGCAPRPTRVRETLFNWLGGT